jgi:hypothetical protein
MSQSLIVAVLSGIGILFVGLVGLFALHGLFCWVKANAGKAFVVVGMVLAFGYALGKAGAGDPVQGGIFLVGTLVLGIIGIFLANVLIDVRQ